MKYPPWSAEEVNRLNRWQASEQVACFTCSGSARTCASRALVATKDGWVCACGRFGRAWCHDVMLSEEPPRAPRALRLVPEAV